MKNDNFWLLLINAIDSLGIMAAWTILAIFFFLQQMADRLIRYSMFHLN